MPATTQSTTQTTPRKRRKMTIEEALRWAIRDELPKRREDRGTVGPKLAGDAIWRMGAFGKVDNWNREPGMPLAMGDPHPDALVIEGQLNALCEALKLAAQGSAPCPLDLNPYTIDDRLKGKADLGVMTSAALDGTPGWLLTCAIRGTRPDVGHGPMCEPVMSANGKITLWRTMHTPCGKGADGEEYFTSHDEVAASKGDGRDTGLFCKLKWTRTPADWIEEQLRHAFWHAALVYLVPGLQFLTSVEVLPPAAPAEPWLAPAEDEREPLPNLRPARRVELKDRRPAGRRTVRRQASPVRRIDPASWTPPGERSA